MSISKSAQRFSAVSTGSSNLSPGVSFLNPPRAGGGGGGPTGQASTVYALTGSRVVTRYKSVVSFPVYSVVTT